jgi:hypothetical protein
LPFLQQGGQAESLHLTLLSPRRLSVTLTHKEERYSVVDACASTTSPRVAKKIEKASHYSFLLRKLRTWCYLLVLLEVPM